MELTQNQKEDKQFILNPGKWPKWPSLPMKNKDQCGFMLDKIPLGKPIPKDHKCFRTVYCVNPWEFFTKEDRPKIADVPTKVYESVDEMLADGWVVD